MPLQLTPVVNARPHWTDIQENDYVQQDQIIRRLVARWGATGAVHPREARAIFDAIEKMGTLYDNALASIRAIHGERGAD